MKLSRRALLSHAAAITALPACRPSEAEPSGSERTTGHNTTDTGSSTAEKLPNIVYIFLDQLRGTVWGPGGNPAVITPNLDALSASSVVFTECFTNAPLCRPGRAVMMTGRYPHQTGIIHNTTVPTPAFPSHVRRMRDEAGYYTMVIGKFHLYEAMGHTDEYKDNLVTWGFSDSIELLGQTDSTERESPYSDYLTSVTPEGETDKWERYKDYVNNYTWFSPPPDVEPWLLPTEDHLDQFCARLAADWIRSYDKDQPFYIQVNLPGPHKPFNATTEFRDLYDPDTAPFPEPILVLPELPSQLTEQYLALKQEEWTLETWKTLAWAYYATVTLVDDAIGQVIAALEEAGRLEDTWIIVCGDHGEMLADHMITGKVVFYEGAIRQVLLLRPPAGTDPWTCTGLTDQVDVTATILEIAGLSLEDDQPGVSLLDKIIEGPDAPNAQEHKEEVFGGDLGFYFVRTDRFKAGIDPKRKRVVELYDLEADPDELVNLYLDPALESKRRELYDRFLSYYEGWPRLSMDPDSTSGGGS